eukprot:9299478-Pyramimonas_sp.AAC.1
MEADGIAHSTTALAARGLAALPPGTVEVLGIKARELDVLGYSKFAGYWREFLDPPASRDSVVDEDSGDEIITIDKDKRERRPIPVFYRTCQGHTCLVPNIERMYTPYEPGMAKCHGPLLRATVVDSIEESMAEEGISRFPDKTGGPRRERDHGFLRLIPTR